jgi:hypothetical protein
MRTSVATAARSSTVSAGALAAGGGVAAGVLVAALHLLKPELDPSWRFISEYATGRHGWVMMLAFAIWAVSCASLAVALQPHLPSGRGRAGRLVLLVVAVALLVAGVFPQDLVTARPEDATAAGLLHALASMVGIPGLPIAAVLISTALAALPAWRPHRAAILASAVATWVSLATMIVYLTLRVPAAGGFNPEVWAGWMNRLVVATYLVWQVIVARRLLRLGQTRHV